jgi:hypothetical protein
LKCSAQSNVRLATRCWNVHRGQREPKGGEGNREAKRTADSDTLRVPRLLDREHAPLGHEGRRRVPPGDDALRGRGGAPRNPAPRKYFLGGLPNHEQIISNKPAFQSPAGCAHEKYRRVSTPLRSASPFSDSLRCVYIYIYIYILSYYIILYHITSYYIILYHSSIPFL